MIMDGLTIILLLAWCSGSMAFVGGLLASWVKLGPDNLSQEFVDGLIGFGGGILLAAVVFALLPEGLERLDPAVLGLVFLAGGGVFCALDAYLARSGASQAQFVALLLDFIPEALSLGAVFVYNHRLGVLLATFIGVQNLPEGFNAFRELKASGQSTRSILVKMFSVAFLGPIAAAIGYFILQDHPAITASIMAFAGGGILYLLFEDIAPATAIHQFWLPPMGAVLGFLMGMMGDLLINS